MNIFRYVGFSHFKFHPARSILTILGVSFGIALYVAISIINQSTRHSFRENIEAVSGKSKITIGAGPTGFAEENIEKVKAIAGVKYAVPMIEAKAYFESSRLQTDAIYVLGVDLLQEPAVRSYRTSDQEIIDDPLVFMNQPDSIIVTKKFAVEKNLSIDSKVTLATAEGTKTFTVRGMLEPEGAAKAYGGGLAVMDIDGARVSFGKVGKVDRIDIIPEEGASIDALISALKSHLGSGFTVERPESQSESMERMIASYQTMIAFFGSLALLVGLFMVFNSVTISVAERRKEIGILRAIGAPRHAILSVFLTESALIGGIGALFGCLLGRVLANGMVKQVTTSISAQFLVTLQANRLELSVSQFIHTVLLGTVTAAGAALYPAVKASRISPLEAMKPGGLETAAYEKGQSRSVLFGLILLVFAFFSMRGQWNRHFPAIEQLTQISAVLGSAFFGPYFVFLFIGFLRRFVRTKRTPIFRLAQDNLMRSKRRTATNIMALMVGLFLVMLIATVRASFQNTILTWLGDVLRADIIVTSSGRTITADVQPVKEDIEKEILDIPGVRNPGPGRGTASRILSFDSDGTRYVLKAFDHPAEYLEYRHLKLRGRDRLEAAHELYDPVRNAKEPGVFVSENYFLKHPEKKVGDVVELDTPSGRTPFRILAVCVDFASANGVFYMSREVFKKYWKDSLVTAFGLSLEPGADLEAVRRSIAVRVGRRYNLVSLSNAEMRTQMEGAIDETFAYTRAIEGAALMVALLGLLNTLLISVLERTREIGVLRAIGSSKNHIFRMILTEAMIQGGFGAVVAVAIGGFIGKLWVENSLAFALGWMVDFSMPLISVALTIGIGTLVSLIAGLYPAKRAADLPIVEALDYE